MVTLRKKNGRNKPWKVKYWGIGNESWGCGGAMTPEHYSDLLKTFEFFLQRSAHNPVYKIACGPYAENLNWTEKLTERAMYAMDGLSLHYYSEFRPNNIRGPEGQMHSTGFTERDYYGLLKSSLMMNDIIRKNANIIELKANGSPIDLIVDEWGALFHVEPGTNPFFLYQQNSILDALAQLINVLQSVILTEGDRMLLTPTYHVFNMYKSHMNSTLVESFIETEMVGVEDQKIIDVTESASITEDGRLIITISNLDIYNEKNVKTTLIDYNAKKCSALILTADKIDAHNTFENLENVLLKEFTDFNLTSSGIDFTLPTKSIITFEISNE